MSHPAETLLAALEAIDLSAAGGQLDKLEQLLIERQQVLDQLQKTDVSMLDDAIRTHMRTRMRNVLEQDQRTLQGLHETLETTRKDLEKAAQARVASRGYAATRTSSMGRALNGG